MIVRLLNLNLVNASDEETDVDVDTSEYLLRFGLAGSHVHLTKQFLINVINAYHNKTLF